MWVYSSTKRTDIQLRCFEYRKSRSGKWARNFLEGFSGVLITDGYSGYQQPGRKRHPPFCRWPEGMALCRSPQGAEASAIIYSLMETAKANSLRLDDYLLHLLSILPDRAERNKDFEVDDLLPWSEEMKSWFSAV